MTDLLKHYKTIHENFVKKIGEFYNAAENPETKYAIDQLGLAFLDFNRFGERLEKEYESKPAKDSVSA